MMEKKRANQIQVGDSISLYSYDAEGNSITNENDLLLDAPIGVAYSGISTVFKSVEVISIKKRDQRSWDGSRVYGKRYEFFCSDGKTYSAGSGATKYPVNVGKCAATVSK